MIGGLLIAVGVSMTYAVFRCVLGLGIRDAVAAVWLALYAFVFVVSEWLSLGNALGPGGIALSWLALSAAAGGLLALHREKLPPFFAGEVRAWSKNFEICRNAYPCLTWAVLAVLFLTALHAGFAPPFEADALSYHLPRAQHWLANGSIGFYETAIARQNYQPPGFSMVVCHVVALTGTDRWVNLVQWGAFVVSAGVVSLLARGLGGSLKGQLLAAAMALTLPAAISQSLTSVNDLFAAVPVMYLVLALIRLRRPGRHRGYWAAAASMAMGLALLSKWTAVIYVVMFSVPVSVALLVQVLRYEGFRHAFRMGLLLLCVAVGGVAFMVPHCTRNFRLYGNLLSGEPSGLITNVRLTPRKAAANGVRHVATHLALPCAPFNRLLERGVTFIAGDLTNDPDITYHAACFGTEFRLVSPLGKITSWASNPVHFILFTFVGSVWFLGMRRHALLLSFVGIPTLAGAVFYCLMFKWQPWFVRLQIPLFLMMAAGSGVWLEQFVSRVAVRYGVFSLLGGYALLHTLMRPTWYMPDFLFGYAGENIGVTETMPIGEKVKVLLRSDNRREILGKMRTAAVTEGIRGYSLFLTPRDRQYFGNETYESRIAEYRCVKELASFLLREDTREEYSGAVGLLLSSDNGNTQPDEGKKPYSNEYVLWAACGNAAARSYPVFCHVPADDPGRWYAARFGVRPGLLVSDQSRAAVLMRLERDRKLDCLLSNALFHVYAVR